MDATRPPLDYLASCSQMSLESVELSRLNRAANLRKEFQEILDELIDSEVDARLARTILEWRRAHDTSSNRPALEAAGNPPQFGQLALAFPPERRALPAGNAQEHDRQSMRDDVPSTFSDSSPKAPPASRKSERGETHPPTRVDAAPARRRDESVPVAKKRSRSIVPFSSPSTPLARAAAANRDAVQDLVEFLPRKPRMHRKSAASTKPVRKAAIAPMIERSRSRARARAGPFDVPDSVSNPHPLADRRDLNLPASPFELRLATRSPTFAPAIQSSRSC